MMVSLTGRVHHVLLDVGYRPWGCHHWLPETSVIFCLVDFVVSVIEFYIFSWLLSKFMFTTLWRHGRGGSQVQETQGASYRSCLEIISYNWLHRRFSHVVFWSIDQLMFEDHLKSPIATRPSLARRSLLSPLKMSTCSYRQSMLVPQLKLDAAWLLLVYHFNNAMMVSGKSTKRVNSDPNPNL